MPATASRKQKPSDREAVVPHLSVAERAELGKQARAHTPRSSHAAFEAGPDRPDPVALLEEQARTRVPELVPIRYGRMLVSPFTFFRGAARVMARTSRRTPTSGLRVQCCGDAHLVNFGVFASPERRMVFDINDFDETLPGPWEWDVKRLAASLMIAAQRQRIRRPRRRPGGARGGADIARRCAASPRRATSRCGTRGSTSRPSWRTSGRCSSAAGRPGRKDAGQGAHARQRPRAREADRTRRRLAQDRRPAAADRAAARARRPGRSTSTSRTSCPSCCAPTGATLQYDRRVLLEEFALVDFARKVVGVGSVGTRAWIALLFGRDQSDPLFLQIKEAEASVLEEFAGKSE